MPLLYVSKYLYTIQHSYPFRKQIVYYEKLVSGLKIVTDEKSGTGTAYLSTFLEYLS
jgi:hypothetical protein